MLGDGWVDQLKKFPCPKKLAEISDSPEKWDSVKQELELSNVSLFQIDPNSEQMVNTLRN